MSTPPQRPVSLPVVDCADRHSACGAHCCSPEVPLNDDERASGRYQVQPHRPRFLLRADNGHCVYWRDQPLACSIHAERPAACRAYSCYGDTRLWRDFDKRIINRKGIEALVNRGPMPPRDD